MESLKKVSLFFLFLAFFAIAKAQTPAELQKAFTESYRFEVEKNYSTAIATLRQVYSDKSYELNLRLGWLSYMNQQQNPSLEYYKKCIAMMPEATEPLWGILNPQTALNDWVSVENTYLAILKIDPKNSTANYALGTIYYYRKNYAKAKPYYDTALNLSPFTYNYVLMSAWTNYFLGKTNEAKVLFNKVLLLSPSDPSALEGLGMIK